MATPKTATAPSEEVVVNVASAESIKKVLASRYRNEPVVERSISPLYQPYLGKTIQISVNGITVVVPCDGSIFKVPETFADEVDSRIMAVNATINKSTKMADVQSNHEPTPGAFGMF